MKMPEAPVARDDRAEKALERARADLDKGLKRQDLALVLDGLVKLPSAQRAPVLAQAAQLLADHVAERHRAGDWAALRALAAKAVLEPGLTATLPTPQQRDEVRWSLLWGCLRSPDPPRAAALLELLQPALADAPRLQEILAALAIPGGTLPEALARRIPVATADPRLGQQVIRARLPETPAPVTAQAAPHAVLTLCASSPFHAFAADAARWLDTTDPALRIPLAHTAGRLAARELLLRIQAKHQNLAEPARLLAQCALHDESLIPDVVTAVRAVASLLAGGPVTELGHLQALSALWLALVRTPPWDAHVVDLLVPLTATTAMAPFLYAVSSQVFDQCPHPALWAKALRLWHAGNEVRSTVGPELLQRFSAIRGGITALADHLAHAPMETLRGTLIPMTDLMPVRQMEQLLEALWACGGDVVHTELANAVRALRDRVSTEGFAPKGGWKSLAQRDCFQALALDDDEDAPPDLDDITDWMALGLTRAHIQEAMALADAVRFGELEVPAELQMRARWTERLAPLNAEWLLDAVEDAADGVAALALVDRFLAGRKSATAYVTGFAALDQGGFVPQRNHVMERMLVLHGHDLNLLSRLLQSAVLDGGDLYEQRRLAEAVLQGVERLPAPLSPALKRAVALARRVLPKPKKPKAPPKPKKPPKGQQVLPLGASPPTEPAPKRRGRPKKKAPTQQGTP